MSLTREAVSTISLTDLGFCRRSHRAHVYDLRVLFAHVQPRLGSARVERRAKDHDHRVQHWETRGRGSRAVVRARSRRQPGECVRTIAPRVVRVQSHYVVLQTQETAAVFPKPTHTNARRAGAASA